MIEPSTDTHGDVADERRGLLSSVRTIVVKVGTNVLSRPSGEMALGKIHSLIEDVADLLRAGKRVILVSSGAVSMGAHRLGFSELPTYLREKQACAAVGQIRLMAVYQHALENFDVPTAQILLTEDDFSSRNRYLNLRNTMHRLLELGVLPIVNENDSVSTSEIEESLTGEVGRTPFGDNDVLSALVASKLGADLLLLLTDVDGLYAQGPPGEADGSTRPLSVVREITPEIESMAGRGGARGRGGMASKLAAVRVAVESGSLVVIADGGRPGIIRSVLAGEPVGTLFLPRRRPGSRKRWIAFASSVAGRVVVNEGAYEALVRRRSSLLFAGVIRVEEDFKRGDVVSVVNHLGEEFARGITNYDAGQASRLLGKRSEEIVRIAGHNFEELINRDNLAVRE